MGNTGPALPTTPMPMDRKEFVVTTPQPHRHGETIIIDPAAIELPPTEPIDITPFLDSDSPRFTPPVEASDIGAATRRTR